MLVLNRYENFLGILKKREIVNLMESLKRVIVSMTIGLMVCLIALPAHAFLDGKFKKEVEKEIGAVKLVREVLSGGYEVVTAAELKKWMDEKKDMVIVDTMPYEASYTKGHVPGALQLLFPIPEMLEWQTGETAGKTKTDFENLLGPDTNTFIVIYCGFVKCTRSHNGALWAKKMGYKNVYRFAGGIFAWKGANYKLESE